MKEPQKYFLQDEVLNALYSSIYDINKIQYKIVYKSRFISKFNKFLPSQKVNSFGMQNIQNTQSQKIKNFHSSLVSQNLIDINQIEQNLDQRTTVMVKNIPNRFGFQQLIRILEPKFHLKYDIICMPNDKNTNKNYGFSFINFTEAKCVKNFYELMNGQGWEKTNSPKICEVLYSKIQGKNNLIHHYRKAHFYRKFEVAEDKNDKKFITQLEESKECDFENRI